MTRYKGYTNSNLKEMDLYEKIHSHCTIQDGHLIWGGNFSVQGYPVFQPIIKGKKKNVLPRRVLFIKANPKLFRPIVSNDAEKCGRADCILPEHQKDISHGKPGKPSGQRVRQIRTLRVTLVQQFSARGYKPEEIAAGLKINLPTVMRILNKK